MIAAIMQPTYLPWIGYFDLIDTADTFVFLDDAQVLKRSWGVRNRIAGADKELFLTVPLQGHSQDKACPFNETAIDHTQNWAAKHLASLRHTYAKAPHFEQVFEQLEALFAKEHSTIGALNEDFITATARAIGITTPFAKASQIDGVSGRKDARLVSICSAIGAGTYLSAAGSAAYIESDKEGGAFAGSPTAIRYHNFEHPEYSRAGAPFISHLSVIDLLMHYGYGDALAIIRAGRRPMLTSSDMKEASA